MKQKFWLLAVLFIAQISFSQDNTTDEAFGRHEIKINGLNLVLEAFEINYEHNLSTQTSLGLGMIIPFNSDKYSGDFVYDFSFMANPYFRVFFGKKPAQGFFVEANGSLASLNVYYYDFFNQNGAFWNTTRKETEFAFGLGIAAGGKFVLNDKFVAEIYAGLGRYLNQESLGYPRLGINVGYRFN
jgi:hypothetical protein